MLLQSSAWHAQSTGAEAMLNLTKLRGQLSTHSLLLLEIVELCTINLQIIHCTFKDYAVCMQFLQIMLALFLHYIFIFDVSRIKNC